MPTSVVPRTSCVAAPTITSASEYDATGDYSSAQALTDDECDGELVSGSGDYNYWLATSGQTGVNAHLIFDLGCIRTVSSIRLRNSKSYPWNDRCVRGSQEHRILLLQ